MILIGNVILIRNLTLISMGNTVNNKCRVKHICNISAIVGAMTHSNKGIYGDCLLEAITVDHYCKEAMNNPRKTNECANHEK